MVHVCLERVVFCFRLSLDVVCSSQIFDAFARIAGAGCRRRRRIQR